MKVFKSRVRMVNCPRLIIVLFNFWLTLCCALCALPVFAKDKKVDYSTAQKANKFPVTCDGVTDATAAMNSYLASFTTGGIVTIPAGQMCFINSGNIIVPANVRIVGGDTPFDEISALPPTSGFLLNPAYTIMMSGGGSALDNLTIRRSGLVAVPTAAQAISAVNQWCSESSAGVTLPISVGGIQLTRLFIEGFNTAIYSVIGQYTVSHVAADTCNGVDANGGGDNFYIDDMRLEPYYSLNTSPASGSWNRPGIAFYFHDGSSGWYCTRCFSFMWQSGLVASNAAGTVANSGFEWQSSWGNGATGTVGARWINHNAQTSAHNVYLNGFYTAASVEETGEMMLDSMSPAPDINFGVAGYYLGGQTAPVANVTIGGTVAVGNTVTLTFTSASISGSPVAITYKAIAGDTVNSVTAALEKLIVHSQPLIAARVVSGIASANMLTIFWPAATSVAVTESASGSVTATIASGSSYPGSYGMISNTDAGTISSPMPVFLIAPNTLRWNIDGLFESNGNLPSSWLSVGSPNYYLTFSGIPWSQVNAGNVSSCGAGNSVDIHSTDHSGAITEGASATGCTLTFTTPYPIPPKCLVSGAPSGTTVATTTTSITLNHPSSSGAQLTYECNLEF